MAITVLVEFQVPSDNLDTFTTDLLAILPDTQTYDGCLGVELVSNQDQSEHLMLVEQWAARQQHEQYMQWRQDTGVLNRLGALLSAPPKSAISIR